MTDVLVSFAIWKISLQSKRSSTIEIMNRYLSIAYLLSSLSCVVAQSPVWGQCKFANLRHICISSHVNLLLRISTGGGVGWNGATTCVSGSSCVVLNPYYHQVLSAIRPTLALPLLCLVYLHLPCTKPVADCCGHSLPGAKHDMYLVSPWFAVVYHD